MFQAEFMDRGEAVTWVYVPGWSMSGSLFDGIDLGGNRIVVNQVAPATFVSDLRRFLARSGISACSLFGVSMGGLLVRDFVVNHPKLVSRAVLVGVRPGYSEKEVAQVSGLFRRSPQAFLRSFYRACFASEESFKAFMSEKGDRFLSQLEIPLCLAGLGYLKDSGWDPLGWPSVVPLQLFHGEQDQIAPLSEIQSVMGRDDRLIVLPQEGHLCLEACQRQLFRDS